MSFVADAGAGVGGDAGTAATAATACSATGFSSMFLAVASAMLHNTNAANNTFIVDSSSDCGIGEQKLAKFWIMLIKVGNYWNYRRFLLQLG